jgi:PKHD-type hydroxylase
MRLKNYYYWFSSVISPENCSKIIELGESKLREEQTKGNSTEGYTSGDRERGSNPTLTPQNDTPLYKVNEKTYVRDSQVAWLNDKWLYELITPIIHQANQDAGWNWKIDSYEPFQFTKYNTDGFYGWHLDGGSDWHSVYKRYIHGINEHPIRKNERLPSGYTSDNVMVGKVRKISMTLNLNPPGNYDGGDLKFDFGVHELEKDRFHICEEIHPQGSLIVFPSFLHHCVTPVTRGTRYSLVLWSLGEPWK